ncbi:hypothetical protein [Alicyclobacillus mengziensis]|uniref:Uncharacterized protein n=1 Tax=Alicyclobacillus mengziensis TaxID=2931921 RepID=A0A9X7W2R7_9BACL|nr:hypothetical protein [Alicyclobacillus mengziensis]QSO49107.1 hypothetical protein JZ786_09360 [Alicyclobacillus mengziensis]
MAGDGRRWQAMAGDGRRWQAMAGDGRRWQASVGRPALAASDTYLPYRVYLWGYMPAP